MNWHHCPTIHCFMVYVTPRKAESQLLRHILCLEPSVFEPVLYLLFTGTWCWDHMEVRPSQVKIPCPDELAPWNNDCKTSSCWDMLGCLFDFHPSNLVRSPFSSCSMLLNLQTSQVSWWRWLRPATKRPGDLPTKRFNPKGNIGAWRPEDIVLMLPYFATWSTWSSSCLTSPWNLAVYT